MATVAERRSVLHCSSAIFALASEISTDVGNVKKNFSELLNFQIESRREIPLEASSRPSDKVLCIENWASQGGCST